MRVLLSGISKWNNFRLFHMQFLMELIQMQLEFHFGRYFVKCQFAWLRKCMHLSCYALKIISSQSKKLNYKLKVCRAKSTFILIFWEFPAKLKLKMYIMKSNVLFFPQLLLEYLYSQMRDQWILCIFTGLSMAAIFRILRMTWSIFMLI